MRTFILIAILLCTLNFVFGQSTKPMMTAKGMVLDSLTGKPLAYVTLALQDAKTYNPVKSILSKDDGSFEISATGEKPYVLILAFTGYNNKTITLAPDGNSANLGAILLSRKDKQLKEVTVTAVRPVMKREIDGITYDVGADPESVALSALDIMRKVPLITIDASDNIKLKGSGNYKILVNGKESALYAKNPSDVLRSMPATNIEKIEVITTPPAKYDAEGLAGIINIITKKNADQGYNVGINGRYNSIWGPGLNLNGTFKQGKFGLAGYAGYNVHLNQQTQSGNTQNFFADNSQLVQTGENSFGGHNNYADAELSFDFDSLNLITGSFQLFHGINKTTNNQLSANTNASGNVTQQYMLSNAGNSTFEGLDASINYQRGFKKDKNRLLTLSYKYSYSPNSQYNTNTFSDTLNYNLPNYKQSNQAGNHEHTIQADYVMPIKKFSLEAGAKAILRNNFSDFQTNNYVDSTKDYILYPAGTDNFNYNQRIYSLYNSYQMKLKKWTAKAGIRLEHTSIHADFISTSSIVDQSYNNLVPSVSVQDNFKSSSITLGYTNRISRPGIYQLNPFVDASNPKFINTGNPNLSPEINHTFEINYSNFAKSPVNIGLSYAYSKNSIQNVTSLKIDSTANSSLDTVTVTTYQNLGSNSSLRLNFNTNFTITKNLTLGLNGQISHIWLRGTYNGQIYSNDGFTGNAFLNAGFKFGKGYRLGFDAGFFSGDVNLQGQSSGYLYNSYVLSKTFMNKKATISLVANNPYSKVWTYRSHTTTADFYQSSFNQEPYRSFAVRFNFKFGKLNSDIKRNQRGIINDDTKGGKSSSGNQ